MCIYNEMNWKTHTHESLHAVMSSSIVVNAEVKKTKQTNEKAGDVSKSRPFHWIDLIIIPIRNPAQQL